MYIKITDVNKTIKKAPILRNINWLLKVSFFLTKKAINPDVHRKKCIAVERPVE